MNFFIILFLIVGSYIFITWVFFTYVQINMKNLYIKKVTKIIFIVVPFYFMYLWYMGANNRYLVDFWIMSNLWLAFIVVLIIIFSIMFFLYKYLKIKISKSYVLLILKICLILFPIYLISVWIVATANNNRAPSGTPLTKEQLKEYNECRKSCQTYAKEQNPWLFETKIIFMSNKKVFEHPKCLNLFIKSVYDSKRKETYLIYEEVDVVKTIKENGFVEHYPIGKNLIMEINKK